MYVWRLSSKPCYLVPSALWVFIQSFTINCGLCWQIFAQFLNIFSSFPKTDWKKRKKIESSNYILAFSQLCSIWKIILSFCETQWLIYHFVMICSFLLLSCGSSFFYVIAFQVIQTYNRYSAVPHKLLIGKRLAQCLHPALPSGVHLKVLEAYDLIFTQIGANCLAQDLFIYTSGLFPLLSQASMSVKPVLLDLYETHLLPLRNKLYPGLSGFLLALLPGIEEVSEYTER